MRVTNRSKEVTMDKVHEDGTPRPERCLCIKCINQYKRDHAASTAIAYTKKLDPNDDGLTYDMRWDPISPAFNIRVWFE